MEKYVKLSDIRYSLNNIGKVILLKPDKDGYLLLQEEIKLNISYTNSEQYKRLYVAYINPYLETVKFDFDKSARIDVKLELQVFEG